jgi:hypothetical protein
VLFRAARRAGRARPELFASRRIEAAKADWKAGRFGLVTGDTSEFIPPPE